MREQRADRGAVVVNFKSKAWLRELTKMKTNGKTKKGPERVTTTRKLCPGHD